MNMQIHELQRLLAAVESNLSSAEAQLLIRDSRRDIDHGRRSLAKAIKIVATLDAGAVQVPGSFNFCRCGDKREPEVTPKNNSLGKYFWAECPSCKLSVSAFTAAGVMREWNAVCRCPRKPVAHAGQLPDAKALIETEAQVLRQEVERGNRMTIAMALDIAAVGEALGIPGEEQEGGTGEFIDVIFDLKRDADRYRWVKQRAWYVDRAAEVYEIDHIKVAGLKEDAPVDDDDVEAAIDKAMAEEALLGEENEHE